MGLFVAICVTIGIFITQVVGAIFLAAAMQLMHVPENLSQTLCAIFQYGIMLASVGWMAIDSKKIGLHRYQGFICVTPVALVIGGILLWIVVFPAYLCKRWDIIANLTKLKPEFDRTAN